MSNTTLRRLLFGIFVLVPIVNYLPWLLDLQDRFADDADTRVDAAGYAFSIWGLIFLGMIVFSWFQMSRLSVPTPYLRNAQKGLISAGLASIAFVPISIVGDQLLGALDLYWHLVSLIYANVNLRRHVAEQGGAVYKGWTYFAPSIYFGWISAATVIATALGLTDLGVSFPPDQAIWIAFVLILVLGALGAFLTSRADGVYGLTVAWALVAVGVEQSDAELLKLTAWGLAALLIVFALYRAFARPKFFYSLPAT